MKTILITGAKGFIGSSIVKSLKEFEARLILASRSSPQDEDNPSITHVQTDTYDVAFWDNVLPGVDVVYHLAAQTSSTYANTHPMEDMQSNLLPVVSFVQSCQKSKNRPVILFSGAATQIGLTTGIARQYLSDNPITVYDVHKLAAEYFLSYYSRCLGGKSVTLRLANVYGPGPKSSSKDRGILNLMVRKALEGADLTVYGTGEYTRDYVYIDDVVNAFHSAVFSIEKTNGNHYVVGSGQGHTIREMIEMVRDAVFAKRGIRSDILFVPEPEGTSPIEHRNFIADTKPLSDDSGWNPVVTLSEGIGKTVEYYLSL